MPLCDQASTDLRRTARSRLGESLIRLQESVDQTRTSEISADEKFEAWQERWSSRREQIARRLELIDRQLESLTKNQQPRPKLSVVAEDESPHETGYGAR